jgi:hypothetical protein
VTNEKNAKNAVTRLGRIYSKSKVGQKYHFALNIKACLLDGNADTSYVCALKKITPVNLHMRILFLALTTTLILAGCASSYSPINPRDLIYDVRSSDSVGFGYRYDVLTFRGNNKYAKREPKKNIRLVAVKIENKSGIVMKLGETFNLYAGQNLVQPIAPEIVHQQLKQGCAIYLLYSLIWFSQSSCGPSGCETTLVFPIGVPITIGNMIVSGNANGQFKNELLINNLTQKQINPGETAYAIVGISDSGFQPLSIKLN